MEKAIANLCRNYGGDIVFSPFIPIKTWEVFHLERLFILRGRVWMEYTLYDISFRCKFSDFDRNQDLQGRILDTLLWSDKIKSIDNNLF